MATLVVQMGHCYRKSGSTGVSGGATWPSEQDFATMVGNACTRLIHGKQGWTVRLVTADISDYRGDAFVAVHCDGNANSTVRGASVGYQNQVGSQFAQAWKAAYTAEGWTGGFKPDNYTANLAQYYGVSEAITDNNIRAIIIECGFLTSPADRAIMDPTRVARSIGRALEIQLDEEDVVGEDARQIKAMMWTGESVQGSVAEDTLIARVRDLERMIWAGGSVIGTVATSSLFGRVAQLESDVASAHEKLDTIINLLTPEVETSE